MFSISLLNRPFSATKSTLLNTVVKPKQFSFAHSQYGAMTSFSRLNHPFLSSSFSSAPDFRNILSSQRFYSFPSYYSTKLIITNSTSFPFSSSSPSWHQQRASYSVMEDTKTLSFKDLTRKYGTVALAIYLSLSFIVFCCCLASITVLGVTSDDIENAFYKVKTFLGIEKTSKDSSNNNDNTHDKNTSSGNSEEKSHGAIDDKEYSLEHIEQEKEIGAMKLFLKKLNMDDPRVVQFLTNFLLAMAMTKLFSPLKMLLTAMITPGVAIRLQKAGFDLGKNKLKDLAKDASVKIKKI